MRVASSFSASVAALLGASLSQAQYLINEQSFGYNGKISPESNGRIPHYTIQGTPQTPQILSDRVVLTPVAPGNQRSSLWAENPLTIDNWIADVDFRASGPERGGGIFNIWLARGGSNAVGSSSIYTIGRFEGLALVVDQHGGSGGMIRGFLNDGSRDYSQHHNVDKLAFGHCLYSYRNLGRPSQIKLRQTDRVFKVEVDGRLCFESDKISIPTGYNFGVSAATPDSPDSFEVFKLVVMADAPASQGGASANKDNSNSNNNNNNNNNNQAQEPLKAKTQQSQKVADPAAASDGSFDDIPDEDADADVFSTSKAQFKDLHNRLQSTNHQLSAVYRVVNKHNQMDEKRHAEVSQMLETLKTELKGELSALNKVDDLNKKVASLEREFRSMRAELNNKITANERSVKGYLSDHHATMSQTIVDSMPRHTGLVLIFVACQVVLAGGYVAYSRRAGAMPKKYL